MPLKSGKGLESLIPPKSGHSYLSGPQESKKEAVFLIEIDKIKPNPYQPRREFDQESLEALSESISSHGILQPLVVSRIESSGSSQAEYQLIAGERRLLAAKMAKFSRVPVIIRESSSQQKLELSLIENVQRADLNSIERAEAFKKLKDQFGFTQESIAKLVGKSREAVANTLRLLSLPDEIIQAVRGGKISEGHARAILMARSQDKQKEVFYKTIRDGLSVRDAESLVQKLEVWRPKKRTVEFKEQFEELEEKLKETLKIRSLKFKMEAGLPKLIISFKTKKEIENWASKLKSLFS